MSSVLWRNKNYYSELYFSPFCSVLEISANVKLLSLSRSVSKKFHGLFFMFCQNGYCLESHWLKWPHAFKIWGHQQFQSCAAVPQQPHQWHCGNDAETAVPGSHWSLRQRQYIEGNFKISCKICTEPLFLTELSYYKVLIPHCDHKIAKVPVRRVTNQWLTQNH